ncbi:NAD(P)/FAD-dependent oxidoreductase [Pseudonocardia spinosispora]|uniref:NAD(P)/FAD-dependent oxidoreductase n=1 Tax=Pseudonocardia spinosispora TaxID=103441 RepID=UPI000429CBA9|nr:FAD-binding oxidoreductase [Pseudonocardia spinosispora]
MAEVADGPPSSAQAVVVGAGVVGAAIAFNLARLGLTDVVVLDKGTVAGQASGRSGALVRTHYTNVDEARIALAALGWFEHWADRVGGTCGFAATGFLQMVAAQDHSTLRSNVEQLRGIGVDTTLVNADEIRRLQPHMVVEDDAVAAYEPRGGYADPVATTVGLAEAARRLGATVFEQVEVTGLAVAHDRVRGVHTSHGTIEAPIVVVANGAWCTGLLAPLGIELQIETARAQVSFFARPAELPTGPDGHLTIIDRTNGCYLRPAGDRHTLVGLSAFRRPLDDLDGYDESDEPEFTELARRQAARRLPGLADAPRASGHAGPLDITPDRRMVLGSAPGTEGLYLAVGMSGGGFKKAPAIGACLAELIVHGKAATAPIEPFRFSRFAEGQPLTGADYSLPADGVDPRRRAALQHQGLIH